MDSAELDQETIDKISENFAQAIRDGENPSIDRWVSRHEYGGEQLRELLTSVAMIEGLKASALQPVQPYGETAPLEAPTQLDDYQVVREIGRGGMGIVYEAIHESLGRRVAVKVLASHLTGDKTNLRRFQREATAAARLRHPNVVPVFGFGQCGSFHYYVMDFVDGESVSDWLRSGPELDDASRCRKVAEIGMKICGALQYAHSKDVLHRDIKPDNLLLDQQGEVWITDFGLAKLTRQQSMTQTGDLLGTPQYMAPECFEGQFDRRSEIYSVGLTLFEMLTNEPAIAGSNPADTMRKAMSGVTSRPRQRFPGIARDLETVIVKSLAIDRASRYVTAGEMRDDLHRFLNDRPVLARRIGWGERAMRWSRREPVLSSLIIATFSSLTMALVVAGIGYYQTRKALGSANQANAAAAQSLQQRTKALQQRTQALASADKQRVRAENNLQVAITAFDGIMQNIAERGESLDAEFLGELSDTTTTNITSADAELLQSLLGFFDELAENNSEDLRIQSADASRRVGDIYQRLGQLRDSDQAYQRSSELYQALYDQSPEETELVIIRTQILNERAVVAGLLGQPFRSHQIFDETIECLEQSEVATHSPEGRFQRSRAQMLFLSARSRAGWDRNLPRPAMRPGAPSGPPGVFDQPTGRRGPSSMRGPAAMATASDAITTLSDLVEEFPDNTDFRMTLARALRDGAKLASQNRYPAAAKSWARQSIRVFEELLSEMPHSESVLYEITKTLVVTESTAIDRMVYLNRAIRICDSLLADHPNVTRYHALKAHAIGSLAEQHIRSGAYATASEMLRNQIEIQRGLIQGSPELVAYRSKLAQTLEKAADLKADAGQFDQAAKQLQHAIDVLIPAVRRAEPSSVARNQLQRIRNKLKRTIDRTE